MKEPGDNGFTGPREGEPRMVSALEGITVICGMLAVIGGLMTAAAQTQFWQGAGWQIMIGAGQLCLMAGVAAWFARRIARMERRLEELMEGKRREPEKEAAAAETSETQEVYKL